MATRHLVLSRFLLRGEMLPVLYCYPSPWTFIRVNDGSRLIHQGSESRLIKTDYLDPNYWTSCTRNPFQGKVQRSLSCYPVYIFIWLPPKHTQTHAHTHIHTHFANYRWLHFFPYNFSMSLLVIWKQFVLRSRRPSLPPASKKCQHWRAGIQYLNPSLSEPKTPLF